MKLSAFAWEIAAPFDDVLGTQAENQVLADMLAVARHAVLRNRKTQLVGEAHR